MGSLAVTQCDTESDEWSSAEKASLSMEILPLQSLAPNNLLLIPLCYGGVYLERGTVDCMRNPQTSNFHTSLARFRLAWPFLSRVKKSKKCFNLNASKK